MFYLVIRFHDDADLEPLRRHMCGASSLMEGIGGIYILDDSKIKEVIPDADEMYISIKVKGKAKLIQQKTISYFEKDGRSIGVHLEDGSAYTFYARFEEIMPCLSPSFYCCHQSYVVNLEKVTELSRYAFQLNDGVVLPVSQKKYQDAKKYLEKYLREWRRWGKKE